MFTLIMRSIQTTMRYDIVACYHPRLLGVGCRRRRRRRRCNVCVPLRIAPLTHSPRVRPLERLPCLRFQTNTLADTNTHTRTCTYRFTTSASAYAMFTSPCARRVLGFLSDRCGVLLHSKRGEMSRLCVCVLSANAENSSQPAFPLGWEILVQRSSLPPRTLPRMRANHALCV